jgi:FkbH-like protein
VPESPSRDRDIWSDVTARVDAHDIRGAMQVLVEGFDAQPYYHVALQVSRWLREHASWAAGFPEVQGVRVALLGSSTLDADAAYLQIECLRSGLWPQMYVGQFNQFQSEILSPDSALYPFAPEVVFLAAAVESLLPDFDPFADAPRARIDEAVSRLQALSAALRGRSAALLVVHNFVAAPWAPAGPAAEAANLDPRAFTRALNARLADWGGTDPGIAVLDVDHVAGRHGTGRIVDPKLRYLAGMAAGESFLPVLARAHAGVIKTMKGLSRKCVVVDLDGTLWGGTVGEDGPAGIQLGEGALGRAFQDFQRYLLSLWQRGVLLAINSKNNPADAMEVLRDHPGMILRERHFASVQINWDDKPANMLRIAQELNIAAESLLFVDDSPAERLQMRHQLPQVLTVDLPADPCRYLDAIGALNDLHVLTVTAEDRRRGAFYAEERDRAALKAQAGSFEDYLRSLRMTLTIRRLEPADVARAAQLTQRTNQFNLTGRRYSAADLANQPGGITLRVADAFGDSGLVGFALVRMNGPAWHIDTLMLSCRVLGRRVETAFVERIAKLAAESGASRLTAEYVPTARNQVASSFYPSMGFSCAETRDDGSLLYELPVERRTFTVPDWLTLVEQWNVCPTS